MEHNTVGENSPKHVEKGENALPQDKIISGSPSSASAASTTSDFSFEDPYQVQIKEHGSFALEQDQSEQGLLQSGTLPSDTSTSGESPELVNVDASSSTLESPPVQVMERPADASAYRIPSYVFARNKSSTPNAEWSTASNESLFSIHTGNMSFTRDQFSWLLKSGELGTYGPVGGDNIRKSGELGKIGADPGGKYADIRKSGELPPPSPKIVQKAEEQKPVVDSIMHNNKSGELQKTADITTRKSGEQKKTADITARKSGEHKKTADLRKSGEHKKTADIRKSGEQVMSPNMSKSGEQIIAAHFKASTDSNSPSEAKNKGGDVATPRGSGVTTQRGSNATAFDLAAESKKDDSKSGKKDRKGFKPSIDEIPLSASVSHHSDASGQSFAFPVLGEMDREKSVNSGRSRVDHTKDTSLHNQEVQSKTSTAEATRSPYFSWFSCFSRCSCC